MRLAKKTPQALNQGVALISKPTSTHLVVVKDEAGKEDVCSRKLLLDALALGAQVTIREHGHGDVWAAPANLPGSLHTGCLRWACKCGVPCACGCQLEMCWRWRPRS